MDQSVKDRPQRPSRPARLVDLTSPQKEYEGLYRDAYKYIDRGITYLTEGKHRETGEHFERGLVLLDDAIATKIENFDVSAEQIQLYEEMRIKMKCTKKEVLNHFSDLNLSGSSAPPIEAMEDAPPSYDEYLSSLSSQEEQSGAIALGQSIYPDPQSLMAQEAAFDEILQANSIASPVLSPQNGELIFNIENGVQIFFIYSDGKVTSPSIPSFLAMFTFKDPIGMSASPDYPGARGFLQVGEWSYPLVPACSPVLHSFYGAYMFPDPSNPIPGTNVGILIPDSISAEERELFEHILTQMTSFQTQLIPEGVDITKEKKKVESGSERIAKGLVTGAEMLSTGVVWGAEKLTELMNYGSEKIKSSVIPETQPREVDPKWQASAKVARNVSTKAVQISGFVLTQVGKATMLLGRKVAPTLHKHGTKAISHFTGQSEKDSSQHVDGAMEVAAGVVKGASTVYMSLENAAAVLASSLTDNTVKVVAHKYGPEVASVTDDSMHAVGQGLMASHNLSSLGVKGIAKKTAKDASKALVYDYEERKKSKAEAVVIMDGVEEATEAKEIEKRPL